MDQLVLPILELEDKYDFCFTIDGRLAKVFKYSFSEKELAIHDFLKISNEYPKRYCVQLVELKDNIYLAVSEYVLSLVDNKVKALFSTTKNIREDFIEAYKDITEIEKNMKLKVSEWPIEELNYFYENLNKYHIYKLKQSVLCENDSEIYRLFDYKYACFTKLPFDRRIRGLFVSELELKDLISNKVLVVEYFDHFKLKAFYLFMPLSINTYLADLFKI